MRRVLLPLIVVFLLGISVPGHAGVEDEQFISQYFGTTLVVFTQRQVVDTAGGWWANVLLPGLVQNPGYVTGLVNAYRILNGIAPLHDPAQQVVVNYGEYQEPGGWEYRFDFVDVRPSEVEWILDAFVERGDIPAGAEISYRPLLRRSFYASTDSLEKPVKLVIGGREVAINPLSSIATAFEAVDAALRQVYGGSVAFDLSFSQNISRNGYSSASININAELVE